MAEHVQPSVEYYVSVCLSFGLVLTLALMVAPTFLLFCDFGLVVF
jgi:hypothetical protein